MNFYYVDNEKYRVGPISFEELRSRHITESTYVWFAGMGPAWKPAGQVPELAVDRTQAFKWFVQAERHGVSLDEIITDTQLRAEFDQFKQMQPL